MIEVLRDDRIGEQARPAQAFLNRPDGVGSSGRKASLGRHVVGTELAGVGFAAGAEYEVPHGFPVELFGRRFADAAAPVAKLLSGSILPLGQFGLMTPAGETITTFLPSARYLAATANCWRHLPVPVP